jgi:zinc protease
VQGLQRQDLVAFHSTWFKPNNATLVIVGDTTMDEIAPKIEKAFATWQRGDVPQVALPTLPQRDEMTVFIVDKPGAAQSVLIGGHLMPPKSDPQQVPFEVLNAVLGGEFTSRINMNLREEKGYTYGAYSFPVKARGQGMFGAFSAVRTDVTKESIEELMAELRDIRATRPVTSKELTKAQDNLCLQLTGEYESLGEIAGLIQDIVTYGLPDDYMESYSGKVRGTSVQSLTSLAKDWVQPDHMALVVVGDRQVVEPKIRELGFKRIEFLDEDGMPVTQSAAR